MSRAVAVLGAAVLAIGLVGFTVIALTLDGRIGREIALGERDAPPVTWHRVTGDARDDYWIDVVSLPDGSRAWCLHSGGAMSCLPDTEGVAP